MMLQSQDFNVVDLGGEVPDFTLWGMFASADIVVQLVMVMLIAASIWCWAIIFDKTMKFKKLNVVTDAFEDRFWSGESLEKLYGEVKTAPDHPLAVVFVAAMREWQKSISKDGRVKDRNSLQDRVNRVMRVAIARESDRLERSTGFLATVGSTAPFVGLFGTVWGIMNAFQAIAMTSNTSLAVVAPGIAEALLATALGLVAAIPAVVAYNRIGNELGRHIGRMEGFAEEFSAVLSRQMDERSA